MRPKCMRIWPVMTVAAFVASLVVAQENVRPDASWAGKRVVLLEGHGEIDVKADDGRFRRGETNIVSVVDRVDTDGVWVRSPAGSVGKIRGRAVLLEDAVDHLSGLIGQHPADGDAYLRRGDAQQALNQREAALKDYSEAIRLRPDDWFIYMRRARLYNILKECSRALADLEKTSALRPGWEEPYAIGASILSGCQDSRARDAEKAVFWAQKAISLNNTRPTLLTILAAAYAAGGDYRRATEAQKAALASPDFPAPYRDSANRQLLEYEAQVDSGKRK